MRFFFPVLLVLFCFPSLSQTPATPVEYMKYLTDREQQLSKKYLSYMSEVAHGNRARKMEKRRQELIAEIRQSLGEAGRLKPFNGDVTLRDSFRNYWDILLKVFNEDYHKIVDMEAIAEESYDNMEAYLLAQERAGNVLSQASARINPVYRNFAANNNVRLVDGGDSKMERKLRQVGQVNVYNHHIFLIFFKALKQNGYVWQSFNKKDINGLEQNRSTLIKVCDEGLSKLDTLKPFQGDQSQIHACRKVLEYFKQEAETKVPRLSDYILKSDEFAKIKKALDAKPAASRTQTDIDVYNKAVSELNASADLSNRIINETNTSREKVLEQWENIRKKFMEVHVPKD